MNKQINRETVADMLLQKPGSTAGDLRDHFGITAVGLAISSRLSELASRSTALASRKESDRGLRFTLTAKGKKWLEARRDIIQSIDELNRFDIRAFRESTGSKMQKKTPPKVSMSADSERAVDSLTALIENERHARVIISRIRDLCDQFLQKVAPDQQSTDTEGA